MRASPSELATRAPDPTTTMRVLASDARPNRKQRNVNNTTLCLAQLSTPVQPSMETSFLSTNPSFA